MKKRSFLVVAAGVVALLVAGGLFASNMGFKLNYALETTGTNGSASGTSSLALPYNQQTSLVNASDLRADINATAGANAVISISRFVKQSDGLQGYTGTSLADDFTLASGEGYRVQVNADVNYIIVGSHNPGFVVNLDTTGTNGSASGTNDYAYPYHSTASLASELRAEVNAAAGANAVISISKFVKTSDGLQGYTGTSLADDFALVPGESYRVQVNSDVAFIPSHF